MFDNDGHACAHTHAVIGCLYFQDIKKRKSERLMEKRHIVYLLRMVLCLMVVALLTVTEHLQKLFCHIQKS